MFVFIASSSVPHANATAKQVAGTITCMCCGLGGICVWSISSVEMPVHDSRSLSDWSLYTPRGPKGLGSCHRAAAGGGTLGKHEPRIYHDVAVIHADEHAVHADLPQPADGQHSQRRPFIWWRPWEVPWLQQRHANDQHWRLLLKTPPIPHGSTPIATPGPSLPEKCEKPLQPNCLPSSYSCRIALHTLCTTS